MSTGAACTSRGARSPSTARRSASRAAVNGACSEPDRGRDGVGRRDEMIKTSGYRVSPTEIEEVLYQHPKVMDAAVFGIPDPEFGESVAAASRHSATNARSDDDGARTDGGVSGSADIRRS